MSGRPSGPLAPDHVDKPWGHETIWARTDRYVGKVLHVRAGESLSLRYRLVVACGEWDREHLESYVEAHPW